MTAIVDIHARQILDSRGNPTVEVDVTLEDGSMGRAAVPSGASTGAHEAVEKRDGDKSRWGGKGVGEAVARGQWRDRRRDRRIRRRGPGRDRRGDDRARRHAPTRPSSAPTRSSGSAWRRRKAAADARGLPLYRYVGGVGATLLPVPMMNILNGGAHADNPIDFQEFMVMPVGAPRFLRGAALRGGDFPCAEERASRQGPVDRGRRRGRVRAQHRLGPRGARPDRRGDRQAAGYKLGSDVLIALDCASTEFFKDGAYRMDGRGAQPVARRDGRLIWPNSPTLIRSPRSRTAWPRTTWPGGRR